MKACLQSNQCTVPENTTLLQDSTNSMRNLHLGLGCILLQPMDKNITNQDISDLSERDGIFEVLHGFAITNVHARLMYGKKQI